MSIKYTILGILSYKPLTGYDLKKIIQESPFMYWSGNNNQIYKSLVELLNEGFVINEVLHQESSPSKKIYSITKEGLAELKEWILSSSEPPELKKPFLLQLAWADLLQADEFTALLADYENKIRMQILLENEKLRRGTFSPGRTKREKYLWDMIHDNIILTYENELIWLEKLRKVIMRDPREEIKKMDYRLNVKNNKKYIEFYSAETPIRSEQDAVDMISACAENDTNRLLIHSEVLDNDFFRLKTGIAGMILQKFVNYQVKTAVLFNEEFKITGKFKELVAESKKANNFRVFNNIVEAEDWLIYEK